MEPMSTPASSAPAPADADEAEADAEEGAAGLGHAARPAHRRRDALDDASSYQPMRSPGVREEYVAFAESSRAYDMAEKAAWEKKAAEQAAAAAAEVEAAGGGS